MKMEENKYVKYVKTDKYGTEVYHDYRCSRCGGQGYIEHLKHVDGGVCFSCGGSGFRQTPLVVKAYTEERLKVLTKIRDKRLEKKLKKREELSKVMLDKYKEEAELKNKKTLSILGFNAEGVGYVYIGKTFQIKEFLKENGAVFNFNQSVWVSPVDLGDLPKTWHCEVKAEDILSKSNKGIYLWDMIKLLDHPEYLRILNEFEKYSYEHQRRGNYRFYRRY